VKGTIYRLMLRRTARRAMAAEFLGFRQSADEVKQEGGLPDVPVFVLTRGRRVWDRDDRGDRMEKLWFELQGELARRVPRHAHLVALHSGHYIHLDQPQLVVNAVLKVIEVSRRAPQGPGTVEMASGRVTTPLVNQYRLCSSTF